MVMSLLIQQILIAGSTARTSHQCRDSLTVTMLDSNGNIIGRLQRSCNTNVTNSWQQVSFDVTSKLSNYGGQTVTLLFSGKTSGSFFVTSSFFVDDVEVSG